MLNDQLGKYEVKDMNVYIEPLIDELLNLLITSLCMTSLDQYGRNNFSSIEYLMENS